MARENALVQQRLFDRLNMLLHIKGAESEMAEALIEVKITAYFTPNSFCG